jgi:hypothetical protein
VALNDPSANGQADPRTRIRGIFPVKPLDEILEKLAHLDSFA